MRVLRWAMLAMILMSVAGIFFALGWWLRGLDVVGRPILEVESGQGFTVLIEPGPAEGTAIYGPTGRQVPFLSNSDMNMLDPTGRYLFTSHETRSEAGVTRIDLEADEVVILLHSTQFVRLDGLLWTPWDTLLVAEERQGGQLFEILNPLAPPEQIEYALRPAFGQRRHEGLAIDWRGFFYGVDEDPKGSIYRFRPRSPLSPDSLASGDLDVLVLLEDSEELEEHRVQAVWRPAGSGQGTSFDRPEDIEIVGSVLYVAITGEHRVISIDLADPEITTVGKYLSGRDEYAEGLDWPDNLASDLQGNLYIAEDMGKEGLLAGRRNQVWYAVTGADPLARAQSVSLFATVKSARDEPSGLLVDPSGDRLFINLIGSNDSIFIVPLR